MDLDRLVKQTQAVMKDATDAVRGKPTVGDGMLALAEVFLQEDDPERIFYEWIMSNIEDLQGACEEMGLSVEPGPDFYKRLKKAFCDLEKSASIPNYKG